MGIFGNGVTQRRDELGPVCLSSFESVDRERYESNSRVRSMRPSMHPSIHPINITIEGQGIYYNEPEDEERASSTEICEKFSWTLQIKASGSDERWRWR